MIRRALHDLIFTRRHRRRRRRRLITLIDVSSHITAAVLSNLHFLRAATVFVPMADRSFGLGVLILNKGSSRFSAILFLQDTEKQKKRS